jgi:hypothetical protein
MHERASQPRRPASHRHQIDWICAPHLTERPKARSRTERRHCVRSLGLFLVLAVTLRMHRARPVFQPGMSYEWLCWPLILKIRSITSAPVAMTGRSSCR